MKSKKVVVYSVLFLTVGLAVGAIFLSTELNKKNNITPNNIQATSPLNCDLDKTTIDPKSDNNQGNPITEYCPGATGKFKVTNTGKLFLYLSRLDLTVKVNNQAFGNQDGVIATNLIVNKDDYVSVYATIIPNTAAGIGWINPENNLCGGTGWPAVSIQSLLSQVPVNKTIIERQCWGGVPTGAGDFSFNSFQIILAVEPLTTTLLPTNTSLPVTPSSTATATPTSTPIIAAAISGIKVCGANSTCNTDANCQLGSSCFSVSGSKRCVATMCITNGAINDICETDICNAKQSINIEKTVSISCVSGQNKKRLSYTIVLTNPVGNTNVRNSLSVVDTLDARVQSSFIIRTSIPFGGTYNSGKITWNNLSVTANGGRLEIKYDAVVPPSEYGKEYTNNVVVSENGVIRGSQTVKNKIEILPCTALISDQADMIILGILLVFFGFVMYKIGIETKIGTFLWNKLGGRAVAYTLEGDHTGTLFRMDKQNFENRFKNEREPRSQRSQ